MLKIVILLAAIAPRVVSNDTVCTPECTQTFVLENPLLHEMTAQLDCGDEFGTKRVPVPPRSRLTVEIQIPTAPKRPPRCEVLSWHR